MYGNLKTVCFLLSPEWQTKRREREIRETTENLQRYGMEGKVRIFSPKIAEEKFETDIDMSLSNSSIGAEAPAATFGKTAFADFASARYKNGILQFCREERPNISRDSEEVLYLADSTEGYRRLVEAGCPVAGYLHDGNQGEQFPKAQYLLEQPEEVDGDSYVKIWQRLTGRPWTIAVTKRLVIREETLKDLDGRYLLYDEEAQKFLEPPSADREKEREILRAYIEKIYGFYGFGMWGIFDRTSGEMIGRIGFEPYLEAGEAVDFGYLVRKDRRGEGLAEEAGNAVLRFAADSLGLEKVCIHTAEDNAASIHLALQLGFHEEREKMGMESCVFGQKNPERTAQTGGTVDADQKTGIRYFIKDLKPCESEI